MTREMKFRGKDILTDKWVYGDLLHLGNAYAIVTSYEEEELKVNPISDRLEIRVEDIAGVYPETVGQLTGQLDKNKKEIWEGDIVNYRPSCRMCNFYKGTSSVESFRRNLTDMLMRNVRRPFQYRLALKYGLVKEDVKPIIFYYERTKI